MFRVSINGAKGVLFSIAGGEDLGMLEVQDAANVITEAIDPDAKVIFGAVTDPSLKKGAVRVTVIATGFPEGGPRASLFGGGQRFAPKKDQDVPPVTMRHTRESDRVEKAADTGDKTERDAKHKPKEPVQTKTEDEDSWGGLPSFLRRK